MEKKIKVGMADLKVATEPDKLVTLGLGSCVGIALYDFKTKVGGLAHIMLPDSKQARKGDVNAAKYADTALSVLVDEMKKKGVSKQRIVAKIAGGAQMFKFNNGASDIMRVGTRNIEAVKKGLAEYRIPITAEDTGGNFGRTIELDTKTGSLFIKTISKGEKTI